MDFGALDTAAPGRVYSQAMPRTALIMAAVIVSVLPGPANAADFVLSCEPPQGKRVTYGTSIDVVAGKVVETEHGIKWDDDGFSGMYPLFVWREDTPTKLSVAWGNTRPAGVPDSILEGAKVIDAIVTYRDAAQIHAVARNCGTVSCTTFLYAVFPGFGFATRADISVNGGEAMTRVFATSCKRLG